MKETYPTPTLFKLAALLLTFSATSMLQANIIYASEDTFYQRNDKDTVFGSNETLLVKYEGTSSTSKNRVAMVRFDIGTLANDVENSSFSIYLQNATDGDQFTIYGINDLNADDQFDESTLTFNTSVSASGVAAWSAPNVNLSATSLLDTLEISTSDIGTMVSISNSALDDFINADTNGTVSFAIQRIQLNTTVAQFRSTEGAVAEAAHSTAPTLNFAVIPEPSSLLLLSASLMGLSLYRRRK